MTQNTEELILQELFKNKNNNELILQELIKTKNTEELILQELFNLNQKFDDLKNSTQRQFEEIRAEMKALEQRMATKEELKALEEKMATKEDLKRFATKEDLKRFATKEDLKRFATKEELKKELELQAKDIAQIFHNTFNTLEKRENKLKLELLKQIH